MIHMCMCVSIYVCMYICMCVYVYNYVCAINYTILHHEIFFTILLNFLTYLQQFCDSSYTIHMVYLLVALIWRFGESRKYSQIKRTPFRL